MASWLRMTELGDMRKSLSCGRTYRQGRGQDVGSSGAAAQDEAARWESPTQDFYFI